MILPKKLGLEATPKNLNDLKLQKANEEKVAQENLEAAKVFAKDLEDKEVILTLKVGEGGRTFGSVSTKEISEAAKKQLNLDIEKKKLVLPNPIRNLGVTNVPVKLHPKLVLHFTLSGTPGKSFMDTSCWHLLHLSFFF